MDDFGANDCVWRCPKPGAAIESLACMPSICGGSAMLSRGFAESTAVVDGGGVWFKEDQTKSRRDWECYCCVDSADCLLTDRATDCYIIVGVSKCKWSCRSEVCENVERVGLEGRVNRLTLLTQWSSSMETLRLERSTADAVVPQLSSGRLCLLVRLCMYTVSSKHKLRLSC